MEHNSGKNKQVNETRISLDIFKQHFKKLASETESTMADIYRNKRKRLYCCFVDYQKAFDTINKTKLCTKLLSSGISGRILKVIKNLYSQAKCVNVSEKNRNISLVMFEFDKEKISVAFLSPLS